MPDFGVLAGCVSYPARRGKGYWQGPFLPAAAWESATSPAEDGGGKHLRGVRGREGREEMHREMRVEGWPWEWDASSLLTISRELLFSL